MRGWLFTIIIAISASFLFFWWLTDGMSGNAKKLGRAVQDQLLVSIQAKETPKPAKAVRKIAPLPKGTKLVYRGKTKNTRMRLGKSSQVKKTTDLHRYWNKKGVKVGAVFGGPFFDPETLKTIGHLRINGKEYNSWQCPTRPYVVWDEDQGLWSAPSRTILKDYRAKKKPKRIVFFQGVDLHTDNYKTLKDAENSTKRVWLAWPTTDIVEVYYNPEITASEIANVSRARGDKAAIMPDCGQSVVATPCPVTLIQK